MRSHWFKELFWTKSPIIEIRDHAITKNIKPSTWLTSGEVSSFDINKLHPIKWNLYEWTIIKNLRCFEGRGPIVEWWFDVRYLLKKSDIDRTNYWCGLLLPIDRCLDAKRPLPFSIFPLSLAYYVYFVLPYFCLFLYYWLSSRIQIMPTSRPGSCGDQWRHDYTDFLCAFAQEIFKISPRY